MTSACVREFVELAERDLLDPADGTVDDQEIADVMTAAVRLYAARAQAREAYPAPLVAPKVTATEVAIVVSEMLHMVDINMFDLSMWHGRRHGQDR
jgi:hypothetical protein